jgi:2-oxo-4-hydroxy-4-carboxy--5-ureidoimidazoline (OHCU) decarboxylase
VHELPGELTADELAELFGGKSRFVERLAVHERPLASARELLAGLPEEEQLEALNAHPRIGEPSPEQHGDDPATLAELAALNRAYEERFGFRLLVFVAGRSRGELVPVVQERLGHARHEELQTALDELVAIAHDRWRRR